MIHLLTFPVMATLILQSITTPAQTATTRADHSGTETRHALSTVPLHPRTTVVLAIEIQQTWTRKGNFLHRLIRKPLKKNRVLENTSQFLAAARAKGYQVIQAPLVLDKQNREAYKKMPFMPKLMGAFTKGTWKAEFEPGIYQPEDLLVSGRCGFDACEGSDLQSLLKTGGYRQVLVCGFLTDQCVEATMKTLQQNGFGCVLVADCTATVSKAIQRRTERRNVTARSQQLIAKM
jgi:nicotinamidase-related amidase